MKKQMKFWLCILMILCIVTQGTAVTNAAARKKIVVSSQKQLQDALKKAKYQTIIIDTYGAKTLRIPKTAQTKNTTLIVKAPKATIINEASFKKIEINGDKIGKFSERGKNNTIVCNVKNVQFSANSKSFVKKLTVNSKGGEVRITNTSRAGQIVFGKKSKVKAVFNGGIKQAEVYQGAKITFEGISSNVVPVQVKQKDTVIYAAQPLNMKLYANSTVSLKKKLSGMNLQVMNRKVNTCIKNSTGQKIVYKLNGKKYTVSAGAKVNFKYTTLVKKDPIVSTPVPEQKPTEPSKPVNPPELPEPSEPALPTEPVLEEIMTSVPKHLNYFTDETKQEVISLVEVIEQQYDSLTQEQKMEYAVRLKQAIAALQYKKSDVGQVYITTQTSPHAQIGTYVPAEIAVVDSMNGMYETVSSAKAKIKVRGNSTAYADKKPYTFKLDSKQDLFGMGASKKWVLLANALDPTLIRNELVFQFARQIGLFYTSNSRYVDVWLDGQYMGNYQMVEPVDVGETKVDINLEEDYLLEIESVRQEDGVEYVITSEYGYRLAVNEPEVLSEDRRRRLEQYLTEMEIAIKSNDYGRIAEIIDVDSFIDAFITYEVFKNLDVNGSSTRYYIKDGRFYAGPVWDFDLSAGNCSFIFYNYHKGKDGKGSSHEGLWAWEENWFEHLMKKHQNYS